MKVIIAGSRNILDIATVRAAILYSGWECQITEVVSGTAKGPDRLGEYWARSRGVPIRQFPANWRPGGVYDPGAGYKRNRAMADYAAALIAIWDGESGGTRHMIQEAERRGLRVCVYCEAGL